MARIGAAAQIGWKKESVWGTFITPDMKFRCNTENLLPKYDFVQDDTLIASELPATQWQVGESCEGSLEGPLFPDQLGNELNLVLGAESAVADPVTAYILVSYNGASPYARLTKSTNTLTAELSANGSSWSADTNFNTTGSIDLSNASFDTLTELVAAIAGYTGWDCILCGAGGTTSITIADFTATNIKTASVNQGAYMMIATATSATDCKKHSLTPIAFDGDLPSVSIIVDRGLGTNKSFTFSGMSGKTFALSNGAKDTIKSSLALTGKVEAVDQNDVSIATPTLAPYITANLKVIIEDSSGNMTELTEVKTYNITIDPGLDDNRVLGSKYPKQPTKQQSKYELAITANATAAQYALISQYKANNAVSMYIYCKTDAYANSTYNVPYSFFIRIPTFMFSDFSSPTSSKDRYVINMPGKTYKSNSSVWTKNFYCYVVDKITATY